MVDVLLVSPFRPKSEVKAHAEGKEKWDNHPPDAQSGDLCNSFVAMEVRGLMITGTSSRHGNRTALE